MDENVTRCPNGVAAHAYDLATRGTGMLVTIWPNPRNQLHPLPWAHVRGVPLWPQELAILTYELSPRVAAIMHWQKLWAALQEIPIEEAIEDDPPKREKINVRAYVRDKIWGERRPKRNEFKSVFCVHGECSRCKQVDCDCDCHRGET